MIRSNLYEKKDFVYCVLVSNKAVFTMNGGIVTSNSIAIGGNGSDTDRYKDYIINITGGTINSNVLGNGYVSCGVYHPNRGTVNITGGVIKGY